MSQPLPAVPEMRPPAPVVALRKTRPRRRYILAGGGVLALCAGSFVYGFIAHRNQVFPYQILSDLYREASPRWGGPNVWQERRDPAPDDARYRGQEASRLLTLPYLQGYNEAGAAAGVSVHDKARAFAGYNFYVSGHAPGAILIDMNGAPLHEWRMPFRTAFPNVAVPEDRPGFENFWSTSRLLPGGDVLGIFDGLGMVRVDAHSQPRWVAEGDYHHAIDVAADGTIHALSRKKRLIAAINSRVPVAEDFVALVEPGSGRLIREFSLLRAFERSAYASLLAHVDRWGDLLHTNALRILDGGSLGRKAPAFRGGNLLISVPRLNAIAVVDPQTEVVVWALSGMFKSQHNPTPLENGHILLFDNWGRNGASRVLEIEPLQQEIVWEFPKDESATFYSFCCGRAQRLPNGNTLMTESTSGRALEVTPDQQVVWEFVNPARSEAGSRLVATLFQLERFDSTLDVSWASSSLRARASGAW